MTGVILLKSKIMMENEMKLERTTRRSFSLLFCIQRMYVNKMVREPHSMDNFLQLILKNVIIGQMHLGAISTGSSHIYIP